MMVVMVVVLYGGGAVCWCDGAVVVGVCAVR